MNEKKQLADPPKGVTGQKKESRDQKPRQERIRPYSWGTRNTIQLGIFLVTIGIGIQFLVYVLQASGEGPARVARPPGVEGFLPIGALLGWKVFILTGIWDDVHPAAMVILGFAGLISLVLRKSFCGWFCPVGTVSEWLWKSGRKVFKGNYRVPYWLDIPLRSLKYVILGFFLWTVLSMGRSAIFTFLHSPYYKVSDVKMLHFFTEMTTTTAVVLLILVLSSLVVRNSWCRYLCPYGALMGLLALLSPTSIRRNAETCINCGRCAEVCPYHLSVDMTRRVNSPECNACMDCTLVCPVRNTLELKTSGFSKKAWSPSKLGLVIIGLFVAVFYTASITGHWKSSLSEHEFQSRLREISSPTYTHPGIRRR